MTIGAQVTNLPRIAASRKPNRGWMAAEPGFARLRRLPIGAQVINLPHNADADETDMNRRGARRI